MEYEERVHLEVYDDIMTATHNEIRFGVTVILVSIGVVLQEILRMV